MRGINFIVIGGNLGADAELRKTNNGTPVTSFDIAVNEKYKDENGEPKERTIWVRVNIWRKTAEALTPYLKKGQRVHVVGRLIEREWIDKDTGKVRTRFEVVGRDITLLGSPQNSREKVSEPELEEEIIPF